MGEVAAGLAPITVEVAYALPQEQTLLRIEVPAGTTLRGAIERSGILQRHPQIDLARDRVGVFGRVASLDDALRAGDRVEIYRPLLVDPKDARRARAKRSR